jgi:hypothetical protein
LDKPEKEAFAKIVEKAIQDGNFGRTDYQFEVVY